MSKELAKLITEAEASLKEEKYESAETPFKLAGELIEHDKFGMARNILDKLITQGLDTNEYKQKVALKRVLATYKNPDLNRDTALDQALTILSETFDLKQTRNIEALGLAGAIYKRKWEVDGARNHLALSADYYLAGYNSWQCAREKVEQGNADEETKKNASNGHYPAINAAFILDLLIYLDQTEKAHNDVTSPATAPRAELAKKIRKEIIEALSSEHAKKDNVPTGDYWILVTLAEASMGIKDYDSTKNWLAKAREVESISDWQYFSTAKQLAQLAQIQSGYTLSGHKLEQTNAWKALIDFMGDNAIGLRTVFQGKVGLALSGGGFRASLYHIGVLAKLAELDLLRHIEVLSCVSGGSIIGAHYYLEVRRLFDTRNNGKKHDEVTREDYIELVEKIAEDFLDGVQENLRMRVLANPLPNLRMLWSRTYSHTVRLGELYEKLIYSKIKDDHTNGKRYIQDYTVSTPEQPESFEPRRHNWYRSSKIPELILNATTLNSGHNWQFTTSRMGESPVQIREEIDGNTRYRRRDYHSKHPENFPKVRLGAAVGASSCVPGLFEPIAFDNLYEDTTIRLVDGGVYDNQGIAGLIEQDCTVLIVSDATGQLNTDKDPGGGVMKPVLRMNSALMHRVRSSQYEEINARKRASTIRSFSFVHMKEDLGEKDLSWLGCDEYSPPPLKQDTDMTEYGIRKDIQRLIASMRTDLDSFSDLEAYALMTSGYCAMGYNARTLEGLKLNSEPNKKWNFLKVKEGMTDDQSPMYDKLKKHLSVSPNLFFKVWKLHPILKHAIWVIALVVLVVCLYWWLTCPQCKPLNSILGPIYDKLKNITLHGIVITILGLVLGYITTKVLGPKTAGYFQALVNYNDTVRRIVVSLVASPVVSLFALIHLHVFDRIFKSLGKID